MSLYDRSLCHAYGKSFLNLKDSPCVMISHLCFFVFIWRVLDVLKHGGGLDVVLKLRSFDDDFLSFLFLSDFCVLRDFFAC